MVLKNNRQLLAVDRVEVQNGWRQYWDTWGQGDI